MPHGQPSIIIIIIVIIVIIVIIIIIVVIFVVIIIDSNQPPLLRVRAGLRLGVSPVHIDLVLLKLNFIVVHGDGAPEEQHRDDHEESQKKGAHTRLLIGK